MVAQGQILRPDFVPANTPLVLANAGQSVQVSDASVIFIVGDALVLIDPVGQQSRFAQYGRPDIVVLTSVDPSHLGIDTMIGLLRRDTVVLAPQSVIDQLPLMIANNVIAPFEVGSLQTVAGILFTALPADAVSPEGAREYQRLPGDYRVMETTGNGSLIF